MMKRYKISDQKGTLLVEALAMLGLIAMVTPTLYKKSAERLQEIQDINGASQARTMSKVMDAYIQSNFSALMKKMSSGVSTVVIEYKDNQPQAFEVGYSSFLPYGFQPDEIRNYKDPKIYVHRDKDTLVSYVIYPKGIDLGKKRSARMASLVGANGGVVTDAQEAKGTGGAWFLNSSMVNEMKFDKTLLTENSLIVTSNEPVSMSYDDSAKYLYRVPPKQRDALNEYFHNTMVTDMFMGGHDDETDYGHLANEYYSIYNVRKLTLNTNCNRQYIATGTGGGANMHCDQNVADLYIGKPIPKNRATSEWGNQVKPSNGAAWIYGNLAALEENFRLTREIDGTEGGYIEGDETVANSGGRAPNGYDVMKFVRRNIAAGAGAGTGTDDLVILRADNKTTGNKAEVSMIDGFVQALEGKDGTGSSRAEFKVGGSQAAYMHAFKDSTNGFANTLYLNQEASSYTFINKQGGVVRINDTKPTGAIAETYINSQGGKLAAGKTAEWISAAGEDTSARVDILKEAPAKAGQIFTVGGTDAFKDNKIYADKTKVLLENGKIRVYRELGYGENSGLGGTNSGVYTGEDAITGTLSGLATINTADVDIFGATYIGANAMKTGNKAEDGLYNRDRYKLGVAGSAWIDDLLWARRAWLHNAGIRELHAGFKNFDEYEKKTNTAWLNVYDDSIIFRNKVKAATSDVTSRGTNDDIMLQADSSKVVVRDTDGAWAWFEGGSARIGTDANYFFADKSVGGKDGSANVVGSTLANIYTYDATNSSKVNIQKEAMLFNGHFDEAKYKNEIAAKAGLFTIKTTSSGVSSNASDDVQFLVDKNMVRTRYVDFQVEDASSKVRFRVMPDMDPSSLSGEANVFVDGSLHVTGNKVLHVASNADQRAGSAKDANRAMLEIDPEYIQVWSKKKDSTGDNFVGGASPTDYYAMFKINPYDVEGKATSSTASIKKDASVYVRKGAIEIERDVLTAGVGAGDGKHAADEGYGYIKVGRMVHNGPEDVPAPTTIGGSTGGFNFKTPYDTFMVNPAYTSVMHDIKLTTRGGARLSDALPDYVLKGIYNVSNNCSEGKAALDDAATPKKYCDATGFEDWASPYVGMIPYAICPPGYRQMATLVPSTFMMGQAGDLVVEQRGAGAKHWVVNPYQRQAAILNAAKGNQLIYPQLQTVSSLVFNDFFHKGGSTDADLDNFLTQSIQRTEGWFWGMHATYKDASQTVTENSVTPKLDSGSASGITSYEYKDKNGKLFSAVQPLYFQQNNWLKTTVRPVANGWQAYMGFLYNKNQFTDGGITMNDGATSATNKGMNIANSIITNHNEDGVNDGTATPVVGAEKFVWNLFPVPINTIEGIANVYCYFYRKNFNNDTWKPFVDQIDQLGGDTDGAVKYQKRGSKGENNPKYIERLHDPALKYSDPW